MLLLLHGPRAHVQSCFLTTRSEKPPRRQDRLPRTRPRCLIRSLPFYYDRLASGRLSEQGSSGPFCAAGAGLVNDDRVRFPAKPERSANGPRLDFAAETVRVS